MGRKNKAATKRKFRATAESAKQDTNKRSVAYDTEELLNKAEEYVDSFQFELALQFCERALQQEPENLRGIELCGILCLEIGQLERAKEYFSKAIELQPDNGHGKYMYMGQLHTGSEAIGHFMKGIELMKKHITDIAAEAEAAAAVDKNSEVTPLDVSCAYCSVAEIYLTDECFEDDAEAKCEDCLKNAIQQCSSNPEAYQLYASFWLSKDNKQKAIQELNTGLALWLPQWREASEADETDQSNPLSLCSLSYPLRISATKILIELQQYETASEILELLLDEEDEVVETWYLLGWVNHLQGEEFTNNARYYLGKAQKIAIMTKCEDEQLIQHTNDLLDELGGPVGEEAVGGDGSMDIPSDSDEEQPSDPTNGHENMDQ